MIVIQTNNFIKQIKNLYLSEIAVYNNTKNSENIRQFQHYKKSTNHILKQNSLIIILSKQIFLIRSQQLNLNYMKNLNLLEAQTRPLKKNDKTKNRHQLIIPTQHLQTLKLQLKYYPNLIELDVRNNFINQIYEFKHIKNPLLLKKLYVENNPLCQQINYRYPFLIMFPNLVIFDDITLNQNLRHQLLWTQKNMGNQIINFLYKKSAVLKKIMQQQPQKRNFRSISKNIQTVLAFATNKQEQNWYLKNQILKTCMENAFFQQQITKQMNQKENLAITKFYKRQILRKALGNSLGKDLLQKLLSRVQVEQNEEISQVVNEAEISSKLILQQLAKVYIENSEQVVTNYIRERQSQICQQVYAQKQQPFYLCMQNAFVQITWQFLKDELIEFLNRIQCLEQYSNIQLRQSVILKHQAIHASTHYDSVQQSAGFHQTFQDSLEETDRIDPNNFTLNNLQIRPTKRKTLSTPKFSNFNRIAHVRCVQILAKFFLRAFYNKIKHFSDSINLQKHSIQYVTKVLTSFNNKYQFKLLQSSWMKISKYSCYYSNIQSVLNQKRLKMVFKKWKNLKRKKTVILTKLLKRKMDIQKAVIFLFLQKWKLKNSSQKCKNLVSSVSMHNLLTTPSLMKTKKGKQSEKELFDFIYKHKTKNLKLKK